MDFFVGNVRAPSKREATIHMKIEQLNRLTTQRMAKFAQSTVSVRGKPDVPTQEAIGLSKLLVADIFLKYAEFQVVAVNDDVSAECLTLQQGSSQDQCKIHYITSEQFQKELEDEYDMQKLNRLM